MGIKKADFHADFKSLKKFLKNAPNKDISKNVTEICTFFNFTHVRQTRFAFHFFLVHFLKTFSTNFKSA
jgi:hypothetical protein